MKAETTEGNLDKKEFLLEKLRKYVDVPNTEILEIGIGNGRYGRLIASEVKFYYGIDQTPEYVHIAQNDALDNVEYQVGSAEEIPYEKKFDVVLFVNSFHFTDFEKALREAMRVCKGIIVILEPTENTRIWKSQRLNKSSPEFDPEVWEQKMKQLRKTAEFIDEQTIIPIAEKDYSEKTTQNCWVLTSADSQ